MRRTSILASVGGLVSAAALSAASTVTSTVRRPRRAAPPPPPQPASVGKVGDFMAPYRWSRLAGQPRPADTYRAARREAAKLRRKGAV